MSSDRVRAELREAAQAATPGPWVRDGSAIWQAGEDGESVVGAALLAERDALAEQVAQAETAAGFGTMHWYRRFYDAAADADRAEAALARAEQREARVRALPHEDWCCAKGCAGPGFCSGCAGTEADCKCIRATVLAALNEGDTDDQQQ